ncbi:MAG: type II toxin-antitoxin system RelE/ParE family toxin [Devosia sp.]|nr:type II toxin-antitoxin system RelE/ParE family toxin [Devosia sp.]
MTYSLRFSPVARKSWNKLGSNVRSQFELILRRRLQEPHIPSARLKGAPNLYKIKLKSSGYRLAYQVRDEKLVVFVIGVGRRDEFYDELREIGLRSLPGDD